MFRLIIILHATISTMSSPMLMGAVWTDPSTGTPPDVSDNGRPSRRVLCDCWAHKHTHEIGQCTGGGLVVYAKVILHFELNLALCTECTWVAVV